MAEPVSEVVETPGQGLSGKWRGCAVSLGRGPGDGPRLSGLPGGAVDFTLDETLRADAGDVIAELTRAGYDVRLLSGDTPERAAGIAARLGIGAAEGAVGPEAKSALLDRLAEEGRRVLMVGDGLNDAPALARAHAAISPGSALDAARQAADAVILGDGLRAVPLALSKARKARSLMRGNLWLATLYNIVAVPLALAGLATPLLAALAMSASSITVSLNALRAAR